jgi:hypothetical protein
MGATLAVVRSRIPLRKAHHVIHERRPWRSNDAGPSSALSDEEKRNVKGGGTRQEDATCQSALVERTQPDSEERWTKLDPDAIREAPRPATCPSEPIAMALRLPNRMPHPETQNSLANRPIEALPSWSKR